VPYALPAVYLDISSAEAQLGQVHARTGPAGKPSDGWVKQVCVADWPSLRFLLIHTCYKFPAPYIKIRKLHTV